MLIGTLTSRKKGLVIVDRFPLETRKELKIYSISFCFSSVDGLLLDRLSMRAKSRGIFVSLKEEI